jgi:hypothetical protein
MQKKIISFIKKADTSPVGYEDDCFLEEAALPPANPVFERFKDVVSPRSVDGFLTDFVDSIPFGKEYASVEKEAIPDYSAFLADDYLSAFVLYVVDRTPGQNEAILSMHKTGACDIYSKQFVKPVLAKAFEQKLHSLCLV